MRSPPALRWQAGRGYTWHDAVQLPVVIARAAASGPVRGTTMGSKTDKITGRIKEVVGVLTDNDNLKREGQRDQVVGEVKEKAERVAEKVQEKVTRAVKKVKNA